MNIDDDKLEYVRKVANEIMPEYDGGCCQVESNAVNVFFYRLDKIKLPFTYKQYSDNEEIQATLKGYEIDKEKFWYAILFIYDITQEKCVNVLTLGDSLKVQAESLRDRLDGVNEFTITVSNKKKLKINDASLINGLCGHLDEILAGSGDTLNSRTFKLVAPSEDLYSPSIQMWFASERFLRLFKSMKIPNKRSRDSAVKYENDIVGNAIESVAVSGGNNIASYSKMLLISQLMYFMGYTRNEAFLGRDNSLRGIRKQYKGYVLNTFSKVYFA